MKLKLLASVGICTLVVAAPFRADAQVIYDFEGFSGRFSYTAPGFITGPTTVSAIALNTCVGDLGMCQSVGFVPNFDPTSAQITFTSEIGEGPGITSIFTYFALGSFSTPGVHTSLFRFNPGTLTVRQVETAVPEPTTWAMMIGGFGMVGGAMRSARRKRKVAVSYA